MLVCLHRCIIAVKIGSRKCIGEGVATKWTNHGRCSLRCCDSVVTFLGRCTSACGIGYSIGYADTRCLHVEPCPLLDAF